MYRSSRLVQNSASLSQKFSMSWLKSPKMTKFARNDAAICAPPTNYVDSVEPWNAKHNKTAWIQQSLAMENAIRKCTSGYSGAISRSWIMPKGLSSRIQMRISLKKCRFHCSERRSHIQTSAFCYSFTQPTNRIL